MRNLFGGCAVLVALGLVGCADIKPSTSIHQPMTARPMERNQIAYNDGRSTMPRTLVPCLRIGVPAWSATF